MILKLFFFLLHTSFRYNEFWCFILPFFFLDLYDQIDLTGQLMFNSNLIYFKSL